MSTTSRVFMGIAMALCTLPGLVEAYPPPPEVVEQWADEGRLDELAAIEAEARSRGVNTPLEQLGLMRKSGAAGVIGGRQAIVLLVDFDDNVADEVSYPVAHFEEMLFSTGTYPTGSLRDYYLENSYGQLDISGTVLGWYRMPETYAYYTNGNYGHGNYPRNAQKLTEHAVQAADPYVDFSQFDSDGPDGIPNSGDDDGYVDALFVVHAGREGAGGNGWAIWSHAWALRAPVPVDGVSAYQYSMEPEEGTIGVFCHELGHVFGLPDLYDYDYDSAGIGNWSVMASGAHTNGGRTPTHFDAWSKIQLGWVEPIVPQSNLLGVQIPPVETDPVVYQLWTDGNPGNEYFLLEFRKAQLFDSFIPWKGLVVYHVDDARSNNNWQCCGSGSPHYMVAVEQADGECHLENNMNNGCSCDAFPGLSGACEQKHEFDATTLPSSRAYDDSDTKVALRNVSIGGGVITLDMDVTGAYTAVERPGSDHAYEGPLLDLCNPFEPGASIQFYVGNPTGVGADRSVDLGIYDVQGRHVRTLASGTRAPGLSRVSWDGLDKDSRPVASGVYFVAFEDGERRSVTKLLLAR